MKFKIKYEPLPAQQLVFGDDTTETILHAGGLGSGKSYNLMMKLFRLSAMNKGHAGGLLCPDYAMFRKDILPTVETIMDLNKLRKGTHWTYNQGSKEFRFIWNKAPLYVFSAEKEIAGPNLGYGGINEYSLCEWERVNEFIRRIRTKAPYPQKILAGTPEDKHGWLQDYVNLMEDRAKKDPKQFKIVYADTDENTHISGDYAQMLGYMLDKKALEVFKSGRIIKISGDLFYYAFERAKNCSEEAIYRPSLTVHANMDFNVGRMTTTFCHRNGIYDDFFDEFELLGNSDTPQAAQEIIKRYGKENVIVTIDASGKNRRTSGASDYQLLLDAGFSKQNIRFKAQNPRFRERQLLVNGRIDKGFIRINPKCKVLIKDLEQVEQSKLDFSKIKDKAGKLTHASDTLDYYVDYEYTLYVNRASSTIQL